MNSDLLEPQVVFAELLALANTHPYSINPLAYVDSAGEPGCVYTDLADPNRHCFAGQYAASKGWPVPAGRNLDNFGAVGQVALHYRWPLTEDGLQVLAIAQGLADNSNDPLPWGQVAEDLTAYVAAHEECAAWAPTMAKAA